MKNRKEMIKQKGFSMELEESHREDYVPTDFSKIKVGIKTLDDAILVLGDLKKANPKYADKGFVLKAIHDRNYKVMREISNFFYRTSGIYNRICRYMAFLYRYDWMVTPYVNQEKELTEAEEKKLLFNFNQVLLKFDNMELKRLFGDIALKVIRNGCYYGYLIPQSDKTVIQELPPDYCRSRYNNNGLHPVIEFNMKFFDDAFTSTEQREKMLKLFPDEFKKGYNAYKAGKLIPDFPGDTSGWYMLDPATTIKFNVNGEDSPMMIPVIPALIDLDGAQDLDRKRMAQKLLKIIIQKMPIDKNGDLVFDVDEAQALHNNAVKMLSKAIGLDVLTTFADVDVASMEESNATSTDDAMERSISSVYQQAGVSQMLFDSDSNIALNNSILNDEASMYNLVSQFEAFLNELLMPYNKNVKKIYYRAQILQTTIYNYKEMAKLYKEQTQLGYSKMLPQIALGQSQSAVLANAYFENDILELSTVFIPPLMSSTMNSETLAQVGTKKANQNVTGEEKTAGRTEKPDNEKSDKTIANIESAG